MSNHFRLELFVDDRGFSGVGIIDFAGDEKMVDMDHVNKLLIPLYEYLQTCLPQCDDCGAFLSQCECEDES